MVGPAFPCSLQYNVRLGKNASGALLRKLYDQLAAQVSVDVLHSALAIFGQCPSQDVLFVVVNSVSCSNGLNSLDIKDVSNKVDIPSLGVGVP